MSTIYHDFWPAKAIVLINSGLGPARIGDVKAILDGEVNDFNSPENAYEFLTKLLPKSTGSVKRKITPLQYTRY